ncbi:MAG: oligogalacturonate lyase family protein [Verrucomicrobiales bacterium]|nr:oligogalacturonate lyase family protein [Verrucomicrobiales bacterium]
MKRASTLIVFSCLVIASGRAPGSTEPPVEWIDPDTGHRVVRLSHEPGSQTPYFHQNAFTPDGQWMVMSSRSGISVVNLRTREVKRLVEGRVWLIELGRKTGDAYFVLNRVVYAASVPSGTLRQVAHLPPRGMVATVNADETLLAGSITERPTNAPPAFPDGAPPPDLWTRPRRPSLEQRFNRRWPMELFVLNIKTGEIKTFNRGSNWLNHIQFSPADPDMLMFCHEGPWHLVDRVWTIRADGSELSKIHARTMIMEIAGHEFWSPDGSTIWYDLQTPRGVVFWLAGYNIRTGERTWYNLQRNEWSVHYNISPDGKMFAGDGGDEDMVAKAPDGKWIYLFEPEPVPNRMDPAQQKGLIRTGVLRATRLVNMSKHDYSLEPNVRFTPDGKWVVFRANFHGAPHVYAVEIAKSRTGP